MTYDGNYWRDHRVWAASERWWNAIDKGRMRAEIDFPQADWEDEQDEGCKSWIPIRFEVCETCGGRGTYVNPAIDADGLTGEDFSEQGEDFTEMYFRGGFDVRCEECQGDKVVPVPTTADGQRMVDELLSERYYDDSIEMQERAWGA